MVRSAPGSSSSFFFLFPPQPPPPVFLFYDIIFGVFLWLCFRQFCVSCFTFIQDWTRLLKYYAICGVCSSLFFLSSAARSVLLSTVKMILMWSGGKDIIKIAEQDQFTAISPSPPKHTFNETIYCTVWKFYFYIEICLIFYWGVHYRLHKGSLLGLKERREIWRYSCGFGPSSLKVEIFLLAEMVFCYCFLVGKWMRRCWMEGWYLLC